MAEPARTTLLLDALVTRVEALVNSINDRDKILVALKGQIDEFRTQTEKRLDEKVAALDEKLSRSVTSDLQATVGYTKDLYGRFEKMIWAGLALLAIIFATIGIQTFSAIPDRINAVVDERVKAHEQGISKLYKQHSESFETQFRTIRTNSEAKFKTLQEEIDRNQKSHSALVKILTDKVAKFNEEIIGIEQDARIQASKKVAEIEVAYSNRFREFQFDVWTQTLRRSTPEVRTAQPEIMRQIIQEFLNVDTARQLRAAEILSDFAGELPEEVHASLRVTLENWDTKENQMAASSRLQLLVRYGSDVARKSIQARVADAIKSNDDDTVVAMVDTVWRAFSGRRPAMPGPRPTLRATDSQKVMSDYLPILTAAVAEPRLARRLLPKLLEIRFHANVRSPAFDALLASKFAVAADDVETLSPLYASLRRFPQDAQFFRAVIHLLARSKLDVAKLPQTTQTTIPSDFISYAVQNASAMRSDPKLMVLAIEALRKFDMTEILVGVDFEGLRQYFVADNLFPRGRKLLLTGDQSVRQQIHDIQWRDQGLTVVKSFEPVRDTLDNGSVVRVNRLSIDGGDASDRILGVVLEVDVDGELLTWAFSGDERFSIHSSGSNMRSKKIPSLQFGVEIRSQQIALMVSM